MKRYLLLTVTLALSWLGYVACGGNSDNGPSTEGSVTPGSPCEPVGAATDTTDGCNTCSCTEDGWVCTNALCPEACSEGATRKEDCNTCTCHDGLWRCTMIHCGEVPPAACPAPREPDPNVGCAAVVVYARSPDAGMCCMYGNPCVAPEGWLTFDTPEECQGECRVGDSKPADDGCNTCMCTTEGWACTEIACADCRPGETRRAPDGCNVCTCTSEGQWGGCTKVACHGEPVGCGARLGDTCTDDEYCAYEEGQYCGAADASATCKPRPGLCTREYAPVCGCDGQTHSNACVANAAGTGVDYSGACR